MRTSLLGTAMSPFAHLVGRRTPPASTPAPKGAKAEDDEDETEEEKKERERREANKAAGRAEDDDGDTDAKGKGKKAAKAEDGDDDSDAADDADASASAIRARERGRCAAIFSDPAAAVRPDYAAHLAFNTNRPRSEAIADLQMAAQGHQAAEPAPAPRRRALAPPSPDLGGPGASGDAPKPGTAAHIMASMKAARGE